MDILYFVHDVNDAAVHKRIEMFKSNGINVQVAGYQRGKSSKQLEANEVVVTGTTYDGRFIQRLASTFLVVPKLIKIIKSADASVIVVRNLEQLLSLRLALLLINRPQKIVYECLDIHRLLLKKGFLGSVFRGAESWCSSIVDTVITSSPGFIREYFLKSSLRQKRILLIENKVFDSERKIFESKPILPSQGPIIIGWFGMIRCEKSLNILINVANRLQGKLEVIIRGKPAYSELPDFHERLEKTPYVKFLGPYKNPEDLFEIYRSIDLFWAIDFFEEGENSEWLLPNRIYEGTLYDGIPIVRANTETARFCDSLKLGLTLSEVFEESLFSLLEAIDKENVFSLKSKISELDKGHFIVTTSEVESIVNEVTETRPQDRKIIKSDGAGGVVDITSDFQFCRY